MTVEHHHGLLRMFCSMFDYIIHIPLSHTACGADSKCKTTTVYYQFTNKHTTQDTH